MNNQFFEQLLISKTSHGLSIDISIRGNSMFPTLKEGDTVTIKKKTYKKGDILVFRYADNELLVHRLLKMEDEMYYCKGDNSFRLEEVSSNDIVGAVLYINGTPVVKSSKKFIKASLDINKLFIEQNYNTDLVKESNTYKEYCKKFLVEK